MEQVSAIILKMVFWGLGACMSGVLFTIGWLMKHASDIKDRATYRDVKEITESINSLILTMNNLENSVSNRDKDIGTLEKAIEDLKTLILSREEFISKKAKHNE